MQSLELDYEALEKSRTYRIFEQSIKSVETKKMYRYLLRQFLRYTNCNSYDEILTFDTDRLQQVLEDYVMSLSDKGLKAGTIKTKLAPVELFLDMNRKQYFKRVVRKLIPSDGMVSGGDVPFTTDEIKRMLEGTTKLRTKALIHFIASTGIRPGALVDPVLCIKHLEKMDNGCYAVRVYDESKEGYYAFLTPEATKSLDNYLNSRRTNKESLTDSSPLFANYEDASHVKNPYLSQSSLKHILINLMRVSGIVRKKNGARYDKAVAYGFRKRFNTILKLNNEVNSNIAEKLMAHKRGLDGSYLKPTKQECFTEFQKAIPELIIDDSERLRLQTKLKDEIIKKAESEKDLMIKDYGERLSNTEKIIRKLEERLDSKTS